MDGDKSFSGSFYDLCGDVVVLPLLALVVVVDLMLILMLPLLMIGHIIERKCQPCWRLEFMSSEGQQICNYAELPAKGDEIVMIVMR